MTFDTQSEAIQIRQALLGWYDRHRRDLPWRVPPGHIANPYHVWLSEIMLQQTTVAAVKSYFERFIYLWPTVHDLAAAGQDDVLREWAGLGYYARGRNLHKAANVIVTDYSGKIPDTLPALKLLPGIGDYTAAAVRSIAFDRPATVIDGNVERVISRLYAVKTPLPRGKTDIRVYAHALFERYCQTRPSCFAQSMMDLGATVCTPKKPKCTLCPISGYCAAYHEGQTENYPFKDKSKPLPQKHGVAYLYVHNGTVYIEKRPETGMLGGMSGIPTSEWTDINLPLPDNNAINRKWFVKHVFTHFSLVLYPVIIPEDKGQGMIKFADIDTIGFPTLFKKLWNIAKDRVE